MFPAPRPAVCFESDGDDVRGTGLEFGGPLTGYGDVVGVTARGQSVVAPYLLAVLRHHERTVRAHIRLVVDLELGRPHFDQPHVNEHYRFVGQSCRRDCERLTVGVSFSEPGAVGLDGHRDHVRGVGLQRFCPFARYGKVLGRAPLRLAVVMADLSTVLLEYDE